MGVAKAALPSVIISIYLDIKIILCYYSLSGLHVKVKNEKSTDFMHRKQLSKHHR